MPSLLWDQHTCLPLRPDADISQLIRYHHSGPSFVSVNVGYAPHSLEDVLHLVERFQQAVQLTPHWH